MEILASLLAGIAIGAFLVLLVAEIVLALAGVPTREGPHVPGALKWSGLALKLARDVVSSRRRRRVNMLTAQRNLALRRLDELRKYANFCELEAKCWPEDSSDRAELLAYAEVARRQADETLRRWRDLERALRAERFEQITGPKK